MFILDLDPDFFSIPDPGSRVEKIRIPDPDPQHCLPYHPDLMDENASDAPSIQFYVHAGGRWNNIKESMNTKYLAESAENRNEKISVPILA